MESGATTSDSKKARTLPVKVLIALDIESRGDDLIRNGILAIGWCVGLADRDKILQKGRVCLGPMKTVRHEAANLLSELDAANKARDKRTAWHYPLDSVITQEFDQQCLNEFWLNEERFPGNTERMKAMIQEAIPWQYGIQALRDMIDRYDDGIAYEAALISDNVAFDFAWVDYYLSAAGLRRLHFTPDGKYRRVFDTVDYRRGVCRMDYGDAWLGERDIIERFALEVDPDSHTHDPMDDAVYIYQFHVQLVNKVNIAE